MKLDDERVAVRGETSFRVEHCLEESLFFMYRGGELSVSEAEEVSSKRRKLSSLMIPVEKRAAKPRRAVQAARMKRYGVLKVLRWE